MRKQARLTTKKFSLTIGFLIALLTLPLVINQLAPTSLHTNLAFASTNLKQIKIGTKDTLWSIARDNRENTNLTIKQAMLAIKDANPHAFPSNNINEMEPNSTLVIPSAVEMSQRTAYQAEIEVRRQNQAWVAAKKANSTKAPAKPTTQPAPKPQPKTSPKPSLGVTPKTTVSNTKNELTQQLSLLEKENTQLTDQLKAVNNELAHLKQLVDLKERQLDEAEQQLASSHQPLAPAPAPVIITATNEDTSLTARMNREPWLYGGYAAAIFFSLTFLLIWLLARGRANYLETELARTKNSTTSHRDTSATASLKSLENLDEFAELSSEDEAALNAVLEGELTYAASAKSVNQFSQSSIQAPIQHSTQEQEAFEQLESLDDLDELGEPDALNELEELDNLGANELELNIDLEKELDLDLDDLNLDDLDLEDLASSVNEEASTISQAANNPIAEKAEDFSSLDDLDGLDGLDDLSSLDNLNDLEDLGDLEDFTQPKSLPLAEAEDEIQKLGLDELVETDLGSLDELDDLGELDALGELDDLASLENELAELEAPLQKSELSATDLLSEDFEEVKYESEADEFLDALDSLEEELNLDDDLNLDDLSIEDGLNLDNELILDDEANEIDTLANNLTSQLDLAAAYIEMGDKTGAKEILEQLVASDDVEIQVKAQQLLESLT